MMRGCSRLHAAAVCAVALLLALAGPARAEWFADAGLDAVYDSNVNRAIDREDRKSDAVLIPAASTGRYVQLADSTGLAVSAFAKYFDFARFNGLDNLEAGVKVSLKYKSGLGSYAPWVKVFGSASYADYQENFRDEGLSRTGLFLGRRINERTFAQLGYEYESGRARNPEFNTRNGSASSKLEYLVSDSVQTWIGLSLSKGVNVLFEAIDPFGDDLEGRIVVNTFGTPMEVYRVNTESLILTAGAGKALTSHWSTALSADFIEIRADGRHYPDSLYKARVVYAY